MFYGVFMTGTATGVFCVHEWISCDDGRPASRRAIWRADDKFMLSEEELRAGCARLARRGSSILRGRKTCLRLKISRLKWFRTKTITYLWKKIIAEALKAAVQDRKCEKVPSRKFPAEHDSV